MRETIGGKNSHPTRRRKRRSNLDISSKRKAKYKKKQNTTTSESISTISTLTTSTTTLDTTSTDHDSNSLSSTETSQSYLSDSDTSDDESEDYRTRRISIYYYYHNVLNCPQRKDWPTAVLNIREGLGISQKDMRTSRLFNLFSIFDAHVRNNWIYLGKRKLVGEKIQKNMIKLNSTEAQIVADAYEDGFSHVACTEILNKYLLENGFDFITTSQVQGVIKRLKPDICTRSRKQWSKTC